MDVEDIFDLGYRFVDSLMTISGNDDDPMNRLLERFLPIRNESRTFSSTFIFQRL